MGLAVTAGGMGPAVMAGEGPPGRGRDDETTHRARRYGRAAFVQQAEIAFTPHTTPA